MSASFRHGWPDDTPHCQAQMQELPGDSAQTSKRAAGGRGHQCAQPDPGPHRRQSRARAVHHQAAGRAQLSPSALPGALPQKILALPSAVAGQR